jgi:hypothetical protein
MPTTRSAQLTVLSVVVLFVTAQMATAQELETESARLPQLGEIAGNVGLEYQLSTEGTELAVPVCIEYGVLNRLELVVEPVAYVAILPNRGPQATGFGDIELTMLGLVVKEHPWIPAIALGGEVKFPTAHNSLIGTGKYDYTLYLILSKRFGNLDISGNVGYSFLGAPAHVHVGNIWDFALSASYRFGERFHMYGEVLGNTSSEATVDTGSTGEPNGELAGGEFAGTLGAGFHVASWLDLSLGVTYDNSHAWLIHPGLVVRYKFF